MKEMVPVVRARSQRYLQRLGDDAQAVARSLRDQGLHGWPGAYSPLAVGVTRVVSWDARVKLPNQLELLADREVTLRLELPSACIDFQSGFEDWQYPELLDRKTRWAPVALVPRKSAELLTPWGSASAVRPICKGILYATTESGSAGLMLTESFAVRHLTELARLYGEKLPHWYCYSMPSCWAIPLWEMPARQAVFGRAFAHPYYLEDPRRFLRLVLNIGQPGYLEMASPSDVLDRNVVAMFKVTSKPDQGTIIVATVGNRSYEVTSSSLACANLASDLTGREMVLDELEIVREMPPEERKGT